MKKLVAAYDWLEAHLLAFSLAFTTILIFIQVIMRYVFNNSLSWSEELARYIFIWQIWLGTSVSMKENEHICLDMLTNKLKGRAKLALALALISNILMLIFCAFLAKYGWELVFSILTRGNRSVALKIPMWLVYLSLPASQLAVALRVLGRLVKNIQDMTAAGFQKEEGQP